LLDIQNLYYHYGATAFQRSMNRL